jgi:nucleoside-diphosphate-sugar epimerase
MNILITGATGFLGSHLLPQLIKRGDKVIVLNRASSCIKEKNIARLGHKEYEIGKTDIEDVFQENSIDVIIHLATDYGKKNNNNICEIINANITLPSKLLELGVKHNVEAFINADTSIGSLYSLYSASKKAFIEIARYFSANHKIKFINFIFEYMYGEGDDETKFIPFAIAAILKGKKIEATAGEQKRDFIYIKDIVGAYIKALEGLKSLKAEFINLNIGTGKSISLKEFIALAEEISGKKADINWGKLNYKKNEIFDSRADISAAKQLLGWLPDTTWRDGLKSVMEWHKQRPKIGK